MIPAPILEKSNLDVEGVVHIRCCKYNGTLNGIEVPTLCGTTSDEIVPKDSIGADCVTCAEAEKVGVCGSSMCTDSHYVNYDRDFN